jgi:hypothetical protein
MSAPTSLSIHEQLARKCIHFNGVMEKVCKAGIKYEDVRIGKPYKFPCLKQGGECKCAEFLTDDQAKEKAAEIEGNGIKTLTAIFAIKAHHEKTKSQNGVVPCQCGGKLHYAVSSFNGHIRAKCDSCGISFME